VADSWSLRWSRKIGEQWGIPKKFDDQKSQQCEFLALELGLLVASTAWATVWDNLGGRHISPCSRPASHMGMVKMQPSVVMFG